MRSQVTTTNPVGSRESSTAGIVIGGLVIGGVLGFGGNFVPPGHVQDLLYAVSAVGLIVASTLLTLEHAARARLLAAAGFALLALGETRLLNPTGVPGGEASFAVGVMLYAPALLLISLSSWAPRWVRATGALAAVFFAAHALAFFAGAALDSTGVLTSVGYTLLTVTIAGWVLTVLRTAKA